MAIVFANTVGLEWGWVFLIGGVFVVVGAGLTAPKKLRASGEAAVQVFDADSIVSKYTAGDPLYAMRVEVADGCVAREPQSAPAVHVQPSPPTPTFGRRRE